MSDEIRRLLRNGQETIVRAWTEKVTSDRRVESDSRLTYTQLVDHVPQIIEELGHALQNGAPGGNGFSEGRKHGRQRWKQGYELKEVVRELTLLRATVMEFIDTYRGALDMHSPEQISQSYHKINGFLDEELYRTVEAYLEAPKEQAGNGSAVSS